MPTASQHVEVAFLGIAERSTRLREGETFLLKWNVIGLKLIVPLFFFPTSIAGWNFVFAFRHATPDNLDLDINLKNVSGDQLGFFKVTGSEQVSEPAPLTSSSGAVYLMGIPEAWHFFSIPFGVTGTHNVVIPGPGRYFLTLKQRDDSEEIIGVLTACLSILPRSQLSALQRSKAIRAQRKQFERGLSATSVTTALTLTQDLHILNNKNVMVTFGIKTCQRPSPAAAKAPLLILVV